MDIRPATVALLCLALGLGASLPAVADRLLTGSTGAKFDAFDATPMDTVMYRGHKDFVLHLASDAPQRGAAPRVVVARRDYGAMRDARKRRIDTLRVTLFRLGDLVDDPGTLVAAIAQIDTAPGPGRSTADSLALAGYPAGLYRLRIEPNRNQIAYRVAIRDIQHFALETWEPRFNFYMLGKDGDPPVTRYFFVPGDGGTVRLRLQTEKGLERARLQVFRVTPTPRHELTIQVAGTGARGTAPAYLTSGTFAATPGDATRPSGQIYRFVLTSPADTTIQPSGNVWVRLSRNVPPYLADSWQRLLVPVVHRQFDPVLYVDSTSTYSAYLNLDRGSPGIGATDTLKIAVGEQTGSTSSGYRVSVPFSAGRRQKVGGLVGQLRSASGAVAYSTDKVDTVYVVQEPTWDRWDDPLYLMYDDGDGEHRSQMADPTSYKTIQCCSAADFQANFDTDVQAMGALYSDCGMDSVFGADPNSERVRFWKLRDEPDSGPGAGGPVTRLRAVYADYYARKQQGTTKMLAMNFLHGIALQEYAEGVDIISVDPYVRDLQSSHLNRLRDWTTELDRITRGANSKKRTVVVLWAWSALDPTTVVDPITIYGDAWRIVHAAGAVDAIATYKWGNPHVLPYRLSGFGDGAALWDSITTRWSGLR